MQLTLQRIRTQLPKIKSGPLNAPTITAAHDGYTLQPAHSATVPKMLYFSVCAEFYERTILSWQITPLRISHQSNSISYLSRIHSS